MSKQWRRGIQGFEESESKDLKKKPTSGLPPIEGDETYAQFTNKYKKAMLNRRQVYKDVSERLSSEGCTTHEFLDCARVTKAFLLRCVTLTSFVEIQEPA